MQMEMNVCCTYARVLAHTLKVFRVIANPSAIIAICETWIFSMNENASSTEALVD